MPTVFGYARVSTAYDLQTASLDAQKEKLAAAGATVIRAEKRSGTTTEGREELRTVLDFIRAGDVLMVTKVDRLARSMADLLAIVTELRSKSAALRVLDQPIDFTGPCGELLFHVVGAVAQFENSIRAERQAEGIAQAKARGVYKGRKRSVDRAKIAELKSRGLGASAIAKQLGIARASVYRS
jgi:DNA invertase Pin-like site-specific DNA recombinase